MKVYYDLVFFLNLGFDFLLLLSTSYILKRNVKLKRLILGSLIGSLSIFLLFIKPNNTSLLLFKIGVSIAMVLVTFSYRSFKYFINNLIYLYLCSILLGGALYLIDQELNYRNYGLLFVSNGIGLNILLILILSPIFLYLYTKQSKKLQVHYNDYYNVELVYQNKNYSFTAFLDTGNKLKDPYKKRPIILLYTDKIKLDYEQSILVPYTTVSGNGLLKCFVAQSLRVENKKIEKKCLIGISKESFKIDGVDMILSKEIIEGGVIND